MERKASSIPKSQGLVFLSKIILGLKKLTLSHYLNGKNKEDALQYKCSCNKDGSLVFQSMLQSKTLHHSYRNSLILPLVTPMKTSS